MKFSSIVLVLLMFLLAMTFTVLGVYLLLTTTVTSPADWFLGALAMAAAGSGFRGSYSVKTQEQLVAGEKE
jgi:hypothetical protein